MGVVGMAHLDGIIKYFDTEEERRKELGMSKKQITRKSKA